MELSPQALSDFKAIYREEFGEELSNAQAAEIALRVLRLFALLMQGNGSPR